MIRRHAIHYIIEKPGGRSKILVLRDSVLTLLVWVMYFYFMRDFFLFLWDFIQYAGHGFTDMAAYPSLKMLGTIADYLGVSLAITFVFLGWSFYNMLRYGKKVRRKFRPPVSTQELGEMYHASPKAVASWQKARVMVMHHDQQGRLTDVMIQD